jgi:hypothetical protein
MAHINPTVQVSWGELIDKLAILEIKEARHRRTRLPMFGESLPPREL